MDVIQFDSAVKKRTPEAEATNTVLKQIEAIDQLMDTMRRVNAAAKRGGYKGYAAHEIIDSLLCLERFCR